jgi:hypothetical protein
VLIGVCPDDTGGSMPIVGGDFGRVSKQNLKALASLCGPHLGKISIA